MFVSKKKYDSLVEDYNDLLAMLAFVESERDRAGATSRHRLNLNRLNEFWDTMLRPETMLVDELVDDAKADANA